MDLNLWLRQYERQQEEFQKQLEDLAKRQEETLTQYEGLLKEGVQVQKEALQKRQKELEKQQKDDKRAALIKAFQEMSAAVIPLGQIFFPTSTMPAQMASRAAQQAHEEYLRRLDRIDQAAKQKTDLDLTLAQLDSELNQALGEMMLKRIEAQQQAVQAQQQVQQDIAEKQYEVIKFQEQQKTQRLQAAMKLLQQTQPWKQFKDVMSFSKQLNQMETNTVDAMQFLRLASQNPQLPEETRKQYEDQALKLERRLQVLQFLQSRAPSFYDLQNIAPDEAKRLYEQGLSGTIDPAEFQRQFEEAYQRYLGGAQGQAPASTQGTQAMSQGQTQAPTGGTQKTDDTSWLFQMFPDFGGQ